jgi:Cdc6-like AAA superfamily ATPase
MTANPFGVLSPEQLDANYIAENFVDVFTDLPRIKEPSNTFIEGARGTGKSMLLKSLEPEVLLITKKAKSLKDLPFLSVHVPLRKVEFGVTELNRLTDYASVAIGEHLLSMQIAYRLSSLLESLSSSIDLRDAKQFVQKFMRLFRSGGGAFHDAQLLTQDSTSSCFQQLRTVCEDEIVKVRQYYTRNPLSPSGKNYDGALLGFLDFVVPLAVAATEINAFGKVPLFVMLDDADNLPQPLQRVINSWVSTRSTHAVCLKITTQLGYATFRTLDNRLIESPHDFNEVNLSAIYTNDNNIYSKKVEEIVKRRLKLANIAVEVEKFFPKDEAQAQRLEAIKEDIRKEHESGGSERSGKGAARSRDNVTRYAVPRLMRELAGGSRSSHTYSYSGFRSLVDLSSGVIRWFLEPASRMYDRVVSEFGDAVSEIPVGIQDKVLLDWASEFIQKLSAVPVVPVSDDLNNAPSEASLHAWGHESEHYERLRNLIDSLGLLFRQRLLDKNASEQRLFSIVLSDKPDIELRSVLELGVRLGYLQKSDYAAKETVGVRRQRFILARRLAPHYRLDVSGYAAHLFVTSADLKLALRQPKDFVRARLKDRSSGQQLPLEI